MNKEEAKKALVSHKQIICMDCMHPQMVGWCKNYCGLPEALQMAIDALDDNNQWTPCSKSKPKDGERVFVTVVDESGDSPYTYTVTAQYYDDVFGGVWLSANDYVFGEVVAWMKEPLPYQKKR